MKTRILDGRREAEKILTTVKQQVKKLRPKPCLATVLVGRRPDSELYIRMKQRAAARVGVATLAVRLPVNTSQSRLIKKIQELNYHPRVTGILLQLPLPSHLDTPAVIKSIARHKDTDGLRSDSPVDSPFLQALLHLALLGKPRRGLAVIAAESSPLRQRLTQSLQRRGFTVTATSTLPSALLKRAALIISFRGRGLRIFGKDLQPGGVIVDGGIRQREDHVIGDVDRGAIGVAKALSPVPGGTGPLTVAYLLKNTLRLSRQRVARH